jgi:hypothetical protein
VREREEKREREGRKKVSCRIGDRIKKCAVTTLGGRIILSPIGGNFTFFSFVFSFFSWLDL